MKALSEDIKMPLGPEPHRGFLINLAIETRKDARLLGVALSGSLATGGADLESDVDLQIVVEEAAYDEMMRERSGFVARFGRVLAGFTGEHVGEPRLMIVLYEKDLLHVDFKFVTLADFASHRVEDPLILWERGGELTEAVRRNPREYPAVDVQWIEDRFWIWVHYIATKIKRGETIEALDSFAWLRGLALSPLARAIQGAKNRGSRFLERDFASAATSLLTTHPRGVEADQLKEALERAIDTYLALRASLPQLPVCKWDAEVAVRRYVTGL